MDDLTQVEMSAASPAASGGGDVAPVERVYLVTLVGNVSTSVSVRTTETDPEVIARLAEERFEPPTLCYQCSDMVDLEDVWECDYPNQWVREAGGR